MQAVSTPGDFFRRIGFDDLLTPAYSD